MASLMYLCLLAVMMVQLVAPMTSTQSPYLVVEDNGDTLAEDISIPSNDGCKDTMTKHGLNSSSFWYGAAHGIHSLYLEEIREYFEPEASVENKIPVVNTNLSAEQTILFNAPMAGYDKDFKTMALKLMAYYMLKDQSDFAIQGLNTLEKLAHQYHMHEVWVAAVPIYQKMKQTPIEDPEFCPCVNDITGNGILTRLVKIAEDLKYFNYKREPRRRSDYGYEFKNYGKSKVQSKGKRSTEDDATVELVAQYEREYLDESSQDNAMKLLTIKPWKLNSLVGPEQWVTYEAMLTTSMLNDEELKDFATFMYCKLNQPNLDHPKDLFD